MNGQLVLGLLLDFREFQELGVSSGPRGHGRALGRVRDCHLGPEGWLLQKTRDMPVSG